MSITFSKTALQNTENLAKKPKEENTVPTYVLQAQQTTHCTVYT